MSQNLQGLGIFGIQGLDSDCLAPVITGLGWIRVKSWGKDLSALRLMSLVPVVSLGLFAGRVVLAMMIGFPWLWVSLF